MNTNHYFRNRTLSAKSAVLTAGLLFCSVSLGQVFPPYVEPETQPFLTLAPYVLESSNLEPRADRPEGGTLAYRPWFESGAWTGDLIQYEIDKDGRRFFPVGTIGLYPRDGAGWNTMGNRWSARYVFPDFLPYDAEDEQKNWTCDLADVNYWDNRNVFTLTTNAAQVSFRWNTLSTAQKQVLDPAQLEVPGQGQQGANASHVLNYVRGDRRDEACRRTGNPRGYRVRFSVLGAIVNSRPVYVPAGVAGMVVVGANDGMLHAFNAADGKELWAYLPSMLLDKVGLLRISPYRPKYFVDGELRTANIGTITSPRHIVAGGLGAGEKGLMVLDVTTPTSPRVALEFAGTRDGNPLPFAGGISDQRVGHIHGRPTIARLPDGADWGGSWYVVSGNGFGSDSDTAELILVPIDSSGNAGTPIFWSTGDASDPEGLANGLSAPALVDSTGDGRADLAYAGDLRGNLWRFDLLDRSSPPVRLFVTDPDTNGVATGLKPITVQPDVTLHPDTESGYMIYFGTGSLLSAADARNRAPQSMFGIWDRGRTGQESAGFPISHAQIVRQKLVTQTLNWDIPEAGNVCADVNEGGTSTATVRFAVNPTAGESDPEYPQWRDADPPHLGWRVDLPRAGERVLGQPQIRAERIQFITTNPVDMLNPDLRTELDSGSWMLQLDLSSGAISKQRPRALFDLNKNCILDVGDGSPITFTEDGTEVRAGTFPVGLNIGPFNVAQPAFARVNFNSNVGSVVDGVYINALDMPHPERIEDVLHGPLDVTTDSPRGPAHSDVEFEARRATFEYGKQNQSIAEASGPTKPFVKADGLGHRVDGHSFAYNRHHAVNFVDFFELEPQRGGHDGLEQPTHNYRLDIGAMHLDGSEFKLIPAKTESERELNRVNEVGIDDDQKFIIVVANADLSRENRIQIGCRSWPVYRYQTLVMELLRIEDETKRMEAFRNAGLIYSLTEGTNPIRPPDAFCPDSSKPTIRITPTMRIGVMDATMHTLPGCVNNTDLYAGRSGDIAATRKEGLTESGGFIDEDNIGPRELYQVDPHVTKAPAGEWDGYRWRNGALTVQLLKVGPGDEQQFEIQETLDLPTGAGIEEQDFGWGGAYAKAFDVNDETGEIQPITDGNETGPTSPIVSGMLYELSMFWHWGDMADFQTSGQGQAVNPACLGGDGHQPQQMFEGDWFNPGDYGRLTQNFNVELQGEYLDLLDAIRRGDTKALDDLQKLFENNDRLIDYHRLRHYVQNSKQLNRQTLKELDMGDPRFGAGIDGTPVKVEEIEADLLPSLGPNYRPGRRSWIDIAPSQ